MFSWKGAYTKAKNISLENVSLRLSVISNHICYFAELVNTLKSV